MKKLFKLIFVFIVGLMMIPLSSCFFEPTDDNQLSLTTKTVEFKNLSPDYDVKDSRVDLYFYENGSVPLMDVTTFYKNLEGYYYTDGRDISVSTLFNRLYITDKNATYCRVIFDWKYNTVTFKNTLSTFGTYAHGSIDFSAHYTTSMVKGISTLDIKYDLGKYGIDILYYNEKVLMPIAFLNFVNADYYNVAYNGNTLYGYYYGDDIKPIFADRTMVGNIPNDVREETKNELLFLLNEKYGLKEYAQVSDYYSYIGEEKWNKYLTGTNEERSDFIYELIDITLNDPHSRMSKLPFYHNTTKTYSNMAGERYLKIYNTFTTLREQRKTAENYNQPIYYKGNTVFVTFDDFTLGTKDKVYTDTGYQEDAYLIDTTALFYKALTETKASHPEVTNVVFDVSANGGGYVAAMNKVLTFITDKVLLGNKYVSGDYELFKLMGDTNLDGKYDDKPFDFNYYILESEGTFSAANAFTVHSKYTNSVKTIGKRSGGGMCSIQPYVLTDGSMFTLSASERSISGIKNGSSYDIIELESGAPVDYPLEYDDFTNLDKILQIINA